MNRKIFARGLIAGALACAGIFVAAPARAEGPSAEPYEQDAGLLASKIAQHRYRLKHAKDGEARLSEMESAVSELRRKISELKDAASDIASVDSHLRYLRNMELEPKERAIEQLKTQAESDLGSFAPRARSLQARIAQHNAQNHEFGEGQEAALAAYNAEAADLNQQKEALKTAADERQQYWQQQIEAAIAAYAKAQKEFVETEEKRRNAAEKFREHHDAYNAARAPLVESLGTLEREPEPETNAAVPLTPFKQAHPETSGEIVAATRHPVGPGSSRAIEKLQIVAASSNAGAESNVNVTSKTELGYQFDTPEGLAPVDLPSVATPVGESVDAPAEPPPARSVPLVVAEPPPRTQATPVVQAATQRQETNFNKLEQLYQQRRELTQQGPRANAQAWGNVVQEISVTQAKINFEAVTQKLTEGSEGVNLSVRRRPKPIEVPSPTLPEKK
ncbi:MAG: hypothetical protein HYV96_09075 [Opitutae bacterium]|nr:hypothetical protein [Opitutae bacterium]